MDDSHSDVVFPASLPDRDKRIISGEISVGAVVTAAVREFQRKREELRHTEWQRWVPGIGAYRLVQDNVTDNQEILNGMHSLGYEVMVNSWNMVQCFGGVIGIAYALSQ